MGVERGGQTAERSLRAAILVVVHDLLLGFIESVVTSQPRCSRVEVRPEVVLLAVWSCTGWS